MESTSISLSARFRSTPLAEFRLVSRSQKQCFKLPRHAEDRLAPTQTTLFYRVKPSGRLVQSEKYQLRRVREHRRNAERSSQNRVYPSHSRWPLRRGPDYII